MGEGLSVPSAPSIGGEGLSAFDLLITPPIDLSGSTLTITRSGITMTVPVTAAILKAA